MYAAKQGSQEIVVTLLEFGARRDLRDISGNTALLLYSHSRDISLRLLDLLSSPSMVNLPNKAGWWPLVALLSSDHENKKEALLCLLNRGGDSELKTKTWPGPLYVSLLRGDKDLANILLRGGSECNLTTSQR